MTRASMVALLALALLVAPLAVEAQQPGKVYRIGFINASNPAPNPLGPNPEQRPFDAFVQRMRELGYVVGQNLVIETRSAEAKFERLPGLVAELISLKVDLIFAPTTPSARAAKDVTSIVPIVFAAAADPVGDKLIVSLARPGGNVTGVTSTALELSGKRLELLKEIVLSTRRVAVLGNPDYFQTAATLSETQSAARSLGLEVLPVWARTPSEFDTAFSAAARERVGAVVVLPDTMFARNDRPLAEAAIRHRLPTVFEFKFYVEKGGLMSYGPNVRDLYRRAADYMDKIFRGAKPADLPVEQPTKFELVINLTTAKTLGLTIPPAVLARADEVIE